MKNSGLLALLFLALLLRTFVPAGYMIGSAAGGTPALILCPDAGPVAKPAAMPAAMAAHAGHHRTHSDHPASHRESPCPFGALAAPALPPTPPLLSLPTPLPPPTPPSLQARSAAAGLAAPPPPSTGPPLSA